MKRYIIDAENFRIEKQEDNSIFVKASNDTLQAPVRIERDYLASYLDPPIPPGYQYLKGDPLTGFVIQSLDGDLEFTWVPVLALKKYGYLFDSYNIGTSSIFGIFPKRFIWPQNMPHFKCEYLEPLGDYEPYSPNFSFKEQIASVSKFGGFYISTYHIYVELIDENPKGTNWKMLKPCKRRYFSKKGLWPTIYYGNNLDVLQHMVRSLNAQNECEEISYHLPFMSEHDFMLKWISKTNNMEAAIYEDSSEIGNYSGKLLKTGTKKQYCINNIYDITGNLPEWTYEVFAHRDVWDRYSVESEYILRGGGYNEKGNIYPAACKRFSQPDLNEGVARVAMYIKV